MGPVVSLGGRFAGGGCFHKRIIYNTLRISVIRGLLAIDRVGRGEIVCHESNSSRLINEMEHSSSSFDRNEESRQKPMSESISLLVNTIECLFLPLPSS